MGTPEPPAAPAAIEAVRVTPPKDAVMTAICAAAPELAVAVKTALVDAAGTWTTVGTATPVELLDKATTEPPDPAACESVIVQDAAAPAAILVGEHVIAPNTVEANVSDAVFETRL
jgi:hypothetical protein